MNWMSIFKKKPDLGIRTVEGAKHEPQLEADRLTVERLFSAIDQAVAGDTRVLFAIYRDFVLGDPHIQSEFAKRKLAVLGDSILISPADRNKQGDVTAADFIRDQISRGIPGWRHACAYLLDSTLWPVSVMEKVFRVDGGRYIIDRLVPVPHHLEDYQTGVLRIRDQDADGAPLTTTQPLDPNRYIVHRGHLLSAPDNYGGPMRALLFWTLFTSMSRDWWIRFLDRFGAPFLVGKFPAGDDASRRLLKNAFSASTKLFGLAVSKDVDIELKEATSGNGDAFEKFFIIARREQSKLIIGQTLSAEATNPGLGDGGSELHGQVREDIRQFDAIMLLESLTDQMIKQLLFCNGMPGDPPIIIWGSASSSQISAKVGMFKDLFQAGIALSDDSLRSFGEEIGLTLVRISGSPPLGFQPLSADPYYRRR